MGVLPEHLDKIMENVSVLRQSYLGKFKDEALHLHPDPVFACSLDWLFISGLYFCESPFFFFFFAHIFV